MLFLAMKVFNDTFKCYLACTLTKLVQVLTLFNYIYNLVYLGNTVYNLCSILNDENMTMNLPLINNVKHNCV